MNEEQLSEKIITSAEALVAFRRKRHEAITNGNKYDQELATKHISATKTEIRSLFLQAELNWLTAQIERGEKIQEKIGNKHYDGNDLSTAEDYYGLSAESWSEIIRLEDGHRMATSDFLAPLIERKMDLEKLLGKE